MPVAKRKAGTVNKKVGIQVDGSQAIALIHEIESGNGIPDETLLDILHVNASCAAGASDSDKQCKVRGDWCRHAGHCKIIRFCVCGDDEDGGGRRDSAGNCRWVYAEREREKE